jgi:hypothetical protein
MLGFPPNAATRRHYTKDLQVQAKTMKLLGFVLLMAGWGIVISALVLLTKDAARAAFVIAGIGVEVTGIVLVVRAHPAPRGFEY